jgi:hypothetical protein
MKEGLLKSILYCMCKLIPEETHIKLKYRLDIGKSLNLKQPKTFNEKLQWLKLHDRKPEYIKFVDKFLVREYIKEKIGDEYLIPIYGVYNNVNEINWDLLPDKFVVKCTHGSGSNIICHDKKKLNIEETEKQITKWMKTNWYWFGREWPYKNSKPKIICEKYMVDESGTELKDYKIFCFNGEPKLIQVDFDRFNGHKKNVYDSNWDYVPVAFNHPTYPDIKIEQPQKLDEMLKLAAILAKEKPFVRIDFYSINSEIYFGEITFYPASGYGKFQPESYDELLGSWIKLPQSKFQTIV